MPSVDELLNAAEITEATLTETNDVIEIDADTRTMIIPDTERIFGVMSDEKGERKYFRCKRFVGNGIDLSKLDLRVIYQNASGLESGRDKYIVTDLATDGEDYVTFSWELSRKVTAYKGIISFIVCAIKTGTDGIITNEWNTTLANGIVLDGLEVSGTQEQEKEAYDYYKQLEAELEKKAQEVIGTIPSDYTQTLKDVSNLKREVTDGRTDVDGEVHKNIGDAMRGQARKLRGNLVVRQKEQPTDPNNNVWISDEDDEVEVPDVGEFNFLKEDLKYHYVKKYNSVYVTNMLKNIGDFTFSSTGVEKVVSDNTIIVNGVFKDVWARILFKKQILANHKYLFFVKAKEIDNINQAFSLVCRYGTTSILRSNISDFPVQMYDYKNYSDYTDFCAIFSHNETTDVDFTIAFGLNKTNGEAKVSIKDVIIVDVTDLTDAQILEIISNGMTNGVYYNPGKNIADSLIEEAENNIVNKVIKKMKPNPNGYWYGKKCLVIGDSTSATEQWQKKLYENLGMSVTTHAKGGIQFLQMVVGSLGYEGDYDNETGNTGVLQPLKASDVYDKDLIIIFGGFNNRGIKLGEITDLYKTDGTGQNTVTGQLQFVLNWVYDLLKGNESYAQNLKCKIVLVTPYCCGKYSYADYDGYGGDKWAGYTLREMCDRIVEIASLNNCSSYNAWENSGIGRHTWTIYSASPTATKEAGGDTAPYPTNADQLHLNNSVGYPHLGDCISTFVSGIV